MPKIGSWPGKPISIQDEVRWVGFGGERGVQEHTGFMTDSV
jgi:hypothetical protein